MRNPVNASKNRQGEVPTPFFIQSPRNRDKTPMRLIRLLPFALLSSTLLQAAPVSIPSADSLDFGNGTVAIRMTGEAGVQYYVRSTSDLGVGNWTLSSTNPFTGTGSASDIAVPIGNATRRFFCEEDRRGRLRSGRPETSENPRHCGKEEGFQESGGRGHLAARVGIAAVCPRKDLF